MQTYKSPLGWTNKELKGRVRFIIDNKKAAHVNEQLLAFLNYT